MNQRSFTRLSNLLVLTKSTRANQLRQRQNRKLLVESLERREVFANFSPGNLAIIRVDNGATALSSAATASFIDEYTQSGTLVQSIALPTAVSGGNNPLTISGTSTSDGSLNRSSDGNFLVVPGYGASPGTAAVTGTSSATVPRVIARIAADGNVNTATALNTFSANNIRSATSIDGNNFWAVGANSGVQYAALGATGTSFTNVSNTVTNLRTISIFGGNLYANSGSGTTRLAQVGTGLPTTSGQSTTNIPGSPTTGSPYGFFYADLDAGVAGVDTLYVADDTVNSATAGGISKFSLVGGTWISNGIIAAGVTATPSIVSGARGLTGSVSGTTVTLFGSSNGTAGSTTDTLFKVVDSTGYNATLSATPTVIATLVSANAVFRGVAFTPSGGVDTTPPTVTSIDDGDSDNSVLVGTPMTYTVSFSEDINDSTVTSADFDNSGTAAITIGTIAETSPGIFSVQVTPTTVGSLVLRIPTGAVIQDVAGNSLVVPVLDNDTITVTAADTTPPTVISIDDGDADNIVLTNAVLNYTITFSEDIDASTVSASDFVNSGTSAITIGTIVETTPGVFTVAVTPTTAGTLILQIPTGAVIKDVAGNDLVAPVTDNDTLTVNIPDLTPPTLVSITDNVSGGPVLQGQQIAYTVTFSEDINSATVSAADFDNAGTSTISVGTILEPTPGVFTVNVLATSAGTLKLRIPTAAVISDTSGNNLVAPVEDDTVINVNLSALSVGAIAFTAYQADNTGGAGGDFFEFVAITPIAAGQTIYFTDGAYQTVSSSPAAFRTNENLLRWVAQSNIAAGAKVSFTSTGGAGVANTAEWTGINPVTGAFLTSATAAAIGLASAGDQVAAFVDPTFGGTDQLNGTAIAAINFGAATYPATLTGNTDNSLTALPAGLTDGVTAISVGDFSNGRYDPNVVGSIETGTAAVVRTSVNTDTNWENAAAGTVFGTGGTTATFVIGGLVTPTITATPLAKVYDGTAISIVATADDGPGGNAADTSGFTYTYYAQPNLGGTSSSTAPKNAGNYSVDVAYAGNANYNSVGSTAFNFSITAASLTVTGLTGANKVYNATSGATVTGTATITPFGSDNVTLGGTPAFAFADKNVGSGKTITASGYSISGTDAANYVIAQPAGLTANITVASLPVTGLTGANKVYDATAVATVTGTATITALGSDSVTLAGTPAFVFADKNVGSGKSITASGYSISGTDAANYVIVQPAGLSANITVASLPVTGLTGANRAYNATTVATVTGTATVTALGSDSVTLGGTPAFAFADKTVANGKAITASGYSLSGTDAANYSIVQPSGLSANITPFALTGSITAANKVFDGNTSATILTRTLATVFGGDTVTYVGGTATFASSAVGTGIVVTATGLSLSGADAGNYSVNTTATTTADITGVASTIVTRGIRYLGATGSSASTSLATDKVALLPGQSSTFANYSNYSRGLNGIVVDINGLPTGTTNALMLASLQFDQWDGIAAAGFVPLAGAAVPSVSIVSGGGAGGSASVTIAFPDNTVQNTWLRVTVLANADTGLAANDVFYFGNVIGDFNTGNTSTRYRVNALDTSAVRNNQSPGANTASVTNIYDVNRDGRVNALDTSVVRNNQQASGIVAPITAPSSRAASSSFGRSSFATSGNTVGSSAPVTGVAGKNDSQSNSAAPRTDGLLTPNQKVLGNDSLQLPISVNSSENKPVDFGSSVDSNKEPSKLESIDDFFASLWNLG
jgi:YDG domain/Dockerin type I domain